MDLGETLIKIPVFIFILTSPSITTESEAGSDRNYKEHLEKNKFFSSKMRNLKASVICLKGSWQSLQCLENSNLDK